MSYSGISDLQDNISLIYYSDSDWDPTPDPDPEPDPEQDPEDNDMPLPPENSYPTHETLFEAIQSWAREHKYALWVGRLKVLGKAWKKYTYIYTRGGNTPISDREANDLRRPKKRVWNTCSKKTECEFSLCVV